MIYKIDMPIIFQQLNLIFAKFLSTKVSSGGFVGFVFAMYVTSLEEERKIPSEFSLSQNYPNPFNPTTTIKFALPQVVNVNLRIYDMFGRYIETLVNEELEAGYHTVNFNDSHLTSGIYS